MTNQQLIDYIVDKFAITKAKITIPISIKDHFKQVIFSLKIKSPMQIPVENRSDRVNKTVLDNLIIKHMKWSLKWY